MHSIPLLPKIPSKSSFFVDVFHLFFRYCNGTVGIERPNKNGGGIVCDSCFYLSKDWCKRVMQMIRYCALRFEYALEIVVKSKLVLNMPSYCQIQKN